MQLRSFKKYANVAPYTPFTVPCELVDVDGTIAVNSSNAWLQIHDVSVALAGGEVPLKSIFVPISTGVQALPSLFQQLGPVRLINGLTFALSSTAGTYTAVATSFDLFGEVGEWEYPLDPTTTAVGDLTTGLQTQQVWAEAAGGTKTLFTVVFTNQAAATRYLALFATDGMSLTGDKLIDLVVVAASASRTMNYGFDGLKPFQLNTDNSLHLGCSWKVCDTINPLHANAASDVAILSTYKTITTK